MRTTLTESTNPENFAAAHHGVRSTANELDRESQSASTLIEFPSGRNVPEWRKRLSQRVREIQEQKAREAAEAEAVSRAAETVSCALPSGQLELVPEREQAPLNPIVSKALERVERARRENQTTTHTATAAAPALTAVPKLPKEILLPLEATPETANIESPSEPTTEATIETKPKLSIVSVPVVTEPVIAADDDVHQLTEQPTHEEAPEKPKRVRVISDSVEDAALSYLETCLSVPVLPCETRGDVASLMRRTFVGLLDLIIIALIISPVAVGIQETSRNWADPRIIGLISGAAAAAMLAYFTISIALTGRTLAMRVLSVKAIDARTGLIPTGGQSIKRAFGYVFSFAILGLGFAFAFVDRDHRTLHDRFSRTIVVHN
jgi:uncharacterized RDD family membrane protein YckC